MDFKPSVLFHIINDPNYPVKNFYVTFEFARNKKIDLNQRFIIEKKYFSKLKDKFKTNICLNIDNKKYKFLITLYYEENHMTIFKSLNIGICCEIIHIFSEQTGIPLNNIQFNSGKNIFSVLHYDTIGNNFRRRFLLINCPQNINLKINKINKMKANESYKINILPNDIIVQESKPIFSEKKIEMTKLMKYKKIIQKIDVIIQKGKDKLNPNEIKTTIDELKDYDNYFNQYLLNKGEYIWTKEEFISYYYYYKFKLFLNYAYVGDFREVVYYYHSLKIFTNIYEELAKITNVNYYEKICSIVSLYIRLKGDCECKENKTHSIGEYKILNLNHNNIKCYNLAYDFITKIIENIKENSFIFLPILQVNSGFGKDINNEKEQEIFDLSMINVNMIKNHLKLLMPKIIFLVRHPNISKKRGSFIPSTGNIFLYESTIFRNKLGKTIDDIRDKYPEDSAIIVSFTILHEIFMHKKLRDNIEFVPGKETPSKFINSKLEIKNFYYSNIKNKDPLSIYQKDNKKINEVPIEGESGKMLESFFENKEFEIMNYLKKYLGFGDLLGKVYLITDKSSDNLHSYIQNKINEGKIQPLIKEKDNKNKTKKYNNNENDSDINEVNMEEDEEDEEEEDESSELSEETKRIMRDEEI